MSTVQPPDAPKCAWKLTGFPSGDFGNAISGTVSKFAEQFAPDLADLFPFRGGLNVSTHIDETWMAARVISTLGGSNVGGCFTPAEIQHIKTAVLPFKLRGIKELAACLGSGWIDFNTFTYVGPCSAASASWKHVQQLLAEWLKEMVIPEIDRRNQARVLRVIPKPPSYDIQHILQSLWVLECPEHCKQGTAFELEGVGLVTCQHVLGPQTYAFQPSSPAQRFPIRVIAQKPDLDLAIIESERGLEHPLRKGTADNLKLMDHVAVVGFPNFRLGDTGVFSPGLVVAFRPVYGIRRILTNAPIVAGNSGGPVIGSNGKVIGIAVTGADRMETAAATEDHGIIPVDALSFIIEGTQKAPGTAG